MENMIFFLSWNLHFNSSKLKNLESKTWCLVISPTSSECHPSFCGSFVFVSLCIITQMLLARLQPKKGSYGNSVMKWLPTFQIQKRWKMFLFCCLCEKCQSLSFNSDANITWFKIIFSLGKQSMRFFLKVFFPLVYPTSHQFPSHWETICRSWCLCCFPPLGCSIFPIHSVPHAKAWRNGGISIMQLLMAEEPLEEKLLAILFVY